MTTDGMRIGIGLPNAIPGVGGDMLLEWARRAEDSGFAFLTTIGRLGYPSYDSLTALAAVAGATSRIGLVANVVLGPTYPDTLLAKIAITVAEVSRGRLTLGVGVGSRRSDYLASGRSFACRGDILDRQIDFLKRARRGEPIVAGDSNREIFAVGPSGPDIPILVGGRSKRAIHRAVRCADGWTGAGGGPRALAPVVGQVLDAWHEAGRTGSPRLLGSVHFGANTRQRDRSEAYLRSYYAFAGERVVAANVEAAANSPSEIRSVVANYSAIGVNEVTFSPTVPELDEVHRLAELLL